VRVRVRVRVRVCRRVGAGVGVGVDVVWCGCRRVWVGVVWVWCGCGRGVEFRSLSSGVTPSRSVAEVLDLVLTDTTL